MAPKDEDELVDMMFTATHERHPVFIRYPRGPAEGVPIKEQPKLLEIGKAEIVQSFPNNGGRKIALFPLGNMMSMGKKVAAQLAAEGFEVAIVNPRFVKPLDTGATEFFGRAAELAVTFEDHVLMGGYGSAVLEFFNEKRIGTPLIMVGWPDQFIEHGTSVDDLRRKYGLTVENTVARIKAELTEAAPAERRSDLAVA
jgi:1-deoxy-D-xylulose-5-phosphate synthase